MVRTSTTRPTFEATSKSMNSPVRGMTNGEEWERHVCDCAFEFAPGIQPRRLNTAALCKAT